MYKVLVSFSDPVDGGVYYIGQTYPRDGVNPTEERIAYLASDKTKMGAPVIVPREEEAAVKTTKRKSKEPVAEESTDD